MAYECTLHNVTIHSKEFSSTEQNASGVGLEKHCHVCLVEDRFYKDVIEFAQRKESISFSAIVCFMS